MKKFYAVQIGQEDTDCSYGSTVKREAMKMARREAKNNPGMMVRICVCTTESDFCNEIITMQEGA